MKTLADQVRGVPLGPIRGYIESAGIEVSREPGALRFQGNMGETEIRVLEPVEPSLDDSPLKAVVRVRTLLPERVPVDDPAVCADINRLAAFGALMRLDGKPSVVSRLTTYEGEDAWDLHSRLLVWAAAFGADAMDVGGPSRTGAEELEGADTKPDWPATDSPLLKNRYGHRFACWSDNLAFTAEVSLRGGCGTSAGGDSDTALVEMGAIERHPVLGPGLHVLLNLPHRLDSLERAQRAAMELNAWEARAGDMVPHYGAWCTGKVMNPAYTCFFPTKLWHPGFVLNLFTWMVARSQLADGFLVARGVVSGRNGVAGGHHAAT